MSIPWKRLPPLETGLLLSTLAHAFLFFGLGGSGPSGDLLWAKPDTIEIDLTRPYRLTSDPRLARRSENPGTGAAPVPRPMPGKSKPGGGVAQKGNEWVVPTPDTKKLVPLGVEGNPLSKSTAPSTGVGTVEGESGGLGGLGTGGDGEVDWVYLTELPRLINAKEVLAAIRQNYPDEERRAGREGRVVTALHLNKEGRVSSLDVLTSAGALFDDAARRAMAIARFSPARAGDRVVAVKMKQAVEFRLSD